MSHRTGKIGLFPVWSLALVTSHTDSRGASCISTFGWMDPDQTHRTGLHHFDLHRCRLQRGHLRADLNERAAYGFSWQPYSSCLDPQSLLHSLGYFRPCRIHSRLTTCCECMKSAAFVPAI